MTKPANLEDWIQLAYEGCPPAETFLEGELARLEPAARLELDRHAESCPACSAERELSRAFEAQERLSPRGERDLDAMVRELSRRPPHGRRHSGRFSWTSVLRMPAFQLAATLLVLVGVGLGIRNAAPPALTGTPDAAVTRSSVIELIRPVGDLAAAPDELAWTPVDGAESYRITVRGVDDTELWAGDTSTASIGVGAELTGLLRPAVAYLWTVEAFDGEGVRIAWSAPVPFRIDPAEAE